MGTAPATKLWAWAVIGAVTLLLGLTGCTSEPSPPRPPPPTHTITAGEAKQRAQAIAHSFDEGLMVGSARGRLQRVDEPNSVRQCGQGNDTGWPGQIKIQLRYITLPGIPDRQVKQVLSQIASVYTQKHYQVLSDTSSSITLSRVADDFQLRITTDAESVVTVSSPCIWPTGKAPSPKPTR